MSSASKGAQRVGAALSQFAKLGYRCSRVSASGQRKGRRREERCIAGDLIAFAPADHGLPHVIAEIGGAGKRLAVTFAEMLEDPLPPGFVALIGVVVNRRWRWYSDPDSRHESLQEALDAARSA
jgi:hypothetical protein